MGRQIPKSGGGGTPGDTVTTQAFSDSPVPGAGLSYSRSDHKHGMPANPGGGSPGGSDMQLQFNDANAFGGIPGLSYDKVNDFLDVGMLSDLNKFRLFHCPIPTISVSAVAEGSHPLPQGTYYFRITGRVIIGSGETLPSDEVSLYVDGTQAIQIDLTNVSFGSNDYYIYVGTTPDGEDKRKLMALFPYVVDSIQLGLFGTHALPTFDTSVQTFGNSAGWYLEAVQHITLTGGGGYISQQMLNGTVIPLLYAIEPVTNLDLGGISLGDYWFIDFNTGSLMNGVFGGGGLDIGRADLPCGAGYFHHINLALTAPVQPISGDVWVEDLSVRVYSGSLTNILGYTDRGDYGDSDFYGPGGGLNTDGDPYDLDLSGIIPVGTKLVAIAVTLFGTTDCTFNVFKKGYVQNINMETVDTLATKSFHRTIWVPPDANRKMTYQFSGTVNQCLITIRGWFI